MEFRLTGLLVGGFDSVCGIGSVVRNEGIVTGHKPEFRMLESYEAIADYSDMMDLVEVRVSSAAVAANGTTKVELGGSSVDLAPPWRRV